MKKNLEEADNHLINKILVANIESFKVQSKMYDKIHEEIFNKYEQFLIDRDIKYIVKNLNVQSKKKKINVLDLGCGTGNLTLKFYNRRYDVTGVDISPEMLEVLKNKFQPLSNHKNRLSIINSDIYGFLSTNKRKFNIISISSVLHHLPNYLQTIEKICICCKSEGFIYITHEPLLENRAPNIIMRMLKISENLILFLYKKIKGILLENKKDETNLSNSEIKELKNLNYTYSDYWEDGLDLHRVIKTLENNNFQVVKIKKHHCAKTTIRAILDNLIIKSYPNNFRLIAKKFKDR